MRAHRHAQVEVAALAPALPRRALTGQPHPRPGFHTRGDLYLQPRRLEHRAFAAAARAGLLDLPRALAAGTGGAHQSAGDLHLPAAGALGAALRLRSRPHAAAVAFRASRGPLQGDLALRAEDRVAQVDLDLRLRVAAGRRLASRPPRLALAPLGEQVSEHRSQVAKVRRIEAACGAESGKTSARSRALRVFAKL